MGLPTVFATITRVQVGWYHWYLQGSNASMPAGLVSLPSLWSESRCVICFRQQISLFCQFYSFSAKWGLFFATWGLLLDSLYVRKSQTFLLNLGHPIAPPHHSRFRQPNLKLLSLSVQLEHKRWQILTVVCSGGTVCFTVPFQVDDRRSCNGWHGRAARQSLVQILVTDPFLAETANTCLTLCSEADCTVCSAKHTDTDWRAAHCRHNTDDGQCWWEWIWY